MKSLIIKWGCLFILLQLSFNISLAQESQATDDCSQFRPEFPKNEKQPLMRRYTIQELHLGMSLDSAKNVVPFRFFTAVTKQGQLYEYHAEVGTPSVKILLSFTADQQLYQIIYSKRFDTAVSDQGLYERLLGRYGEPEKVFRNQESSKVLEICWGQCLMVNDKTFCQNETTNEYFTYFTVSLDQSRMQLAMMLNDSILKRNNKNNFMRRYQQYLNQPSNHELDQLKL